MYVSRNSIENGPFLRKMKITLVTAIFKAGKKDLVTNYRPISVLFSFSKIIKRMMYNKLYSYFDKTKHCMENSLNLGPTTLLTIHYLNWLIVFLIHLMKENILIKMTENMKKKNILIKNVNFVVFKENI